MAANQKRSLWQIYPKRVDLPLLVIISAAFLLIGLNLPVLTIRKLWEKNTFSIPSGIMSLWDGQYYFLAVIVFLFSIVFPVIKLAMLVANLQGNLVNRSAIT